MPGDLLRRFPGDLGQGYLLRRPHLAAEARQRVSLDERRRYNLGCNGNPVFAEMFRRPATACGGSLLGARLIANGGTVYNPAGGTHHGRPARANGFCYFNDPALAILALLDGGQAWLLSGYERFATCLLRKMGAGRS